MICGLTSFIGAKIGASGSHFEIGARGIISFVSENDFSEQRLQVRGWLSQQYTFSGVQHFGQLLLSLKKSGSHLERSGLGVS